MAAVGTDTLTSFSRRHIFDDGVIDTVYGSNAFFFRWNQGRRRVLPGGYQMELPIAVTASTIGGPFSGWDVVPVDEQDQVINAVWTWKQQYTAVSVNKLTLIKADSPEKRYDYLKAQFELAEIDLADKMGTGLMSDGTTDPKQITGLQGAVDDAGVLSSYAGIPRSTYTAWASNDDSTSTTLTGGVMQSQVLAAKSGGRNPTVIGSDITQYGRFLSLGLASQEFPAGAAGMDEAMYNPGFTNQTFMMIPWIEDSKTFVPSGQSDSAILTLNEFYIELGVNPGADFTMSPFESARVGGQLGWVSIIDWAGELIVKHPGRQSKATAIAA